MVIATLWRLAGAAPVAAAHRDDLARRVPRARQLPLPFPGADNSVRKPTSPWPAKFSLFTWGTKQFREISPRDGTPTLVWVFPEWDAPSWSQRCSEAYYGDAYRVA